MNRIFQHSIRTIIVPALLLMIASATPSFAGPVAELKIHPQGIDLNGKSAAQAVVVTAVDAQGVTSDVTFKANFRLSNSKLAVRKGHLYRPAANGTTTLTVRYSGKSASVPVSVKNAKMTRPLSFRADVMPVFMKSGCNSGSCHGAAVGKDGFRLSLFGYDPKGDYFRLTREIIGRRIDHAVPEKSLFIEKSIGAVTHTGGEVFKKDSDRYRTLLGWVSEGAADDGADTPKPTGIELLPKKIVFAPTKNNKTPMQNAIVMATYSDGSKRDVTRLALYLTNDESVASINDDAVVAAGRNGGAFVFARFDKFTVGSEVIVLPDKPFNWPKIPEHNYIDKLVNDKLKKLQVVPSQLCTDEEFLRRVYLDLVGLPPTVEEYHAFMNDKTLSKKKRELLVAKLIERDEFVDLWVMKWGELLMIRAGRNANYGRDAKAMYKYSDWVQKQVAENQPLDKIVRSLITGSGSNMADPQSNFYTADERLTPQKVGENVAQLFMGTRIQCAQCHNHPFDRWTQDDYYGFAAFFAGIRSKRGGDMRELITFNDNRNNTVPHLLDKRPMKPKFLGAELPEVEGKDPRQLLATWITSPKNKAFGQTMANMVWSHFFGRGIVDPVDDARISNPPSNKELLVELGYRLTKYEYDMKALVKDITLSRTYQLSSRTNKTNEMDTRYFSHGYVRRLRAEVMLDTLSAAVGVPDRFSGMPRDARAAEIHSGSITNYFLTTFGRASRKSVCACEVSTEANLSQALHMINGDTIDRKLQSSAVLRTLVQKGENPRQVIEQLYVRTLTRKPTQKEIENLLAIIDKFRADKKAMGAAIERLGARNSTYRKLKQSIPKVKAQIVAAKKKGDKKNVARYQKQLLGYERQFASYRKSYSNQALIEVYQDILWGLLNSSEFAFNH